MGFAERMGLRPIRALVQRTDLEEETRNELWNTTYHLTQALRDASQKYQQPEVFDHVTGAIWAWEFKKPRDEQPNDNAVWSTVKHVILQAEWGDALDLIEAVLNYAKRFKNYATAEVVPEFAEQYNNTFEVLLVGFRFINLNLLPIDSDTDLDAISSAFNEAKPFKGARHHLDQAAKILADRKKSDYANVIKESISAVESVCVEVTGKHSLGDALKKLKSAGVIIHPSLEAAWSKMYGWTSDASGIRHGSIEAPNADQALAKYMLITCSAFVSYVIETGRKAKLV
jgi:hypothetical protein